MHIIYSTLFRLNNAILQLKENGKLGELQTKWWFDQTKCGGVFTSGKAEKGSAEIPEPLSLDLFYTFGIGLIYAGAAGLAILVGIVEIIIAYT